MAHSGVGSVFEESHSLTGDGPWNNFHNGAETNTANHPDVPRLGKCPFVRFVDSLR